MSAADNIFRDEDWPHGLRCAKCERLFIEGEPFASIYEAMQENIPILLIVCPDCAIGSGQVA